MSTLGNSTFTSIINRANQLQYLDVADLNFINASGAFIAYNDLHVLNELYVGPGAFVPTGVAGTIKSTRLLGDASLTISTTTGDLDLIATNGNLNLSSLTGDVGIGSTLGNITITTASGDIDLDTGAGSSINIGETSQSLALSKNGGRIGFFDAPPAPQPASIPNPVSSIADNNAAILLIIAALEALGLLQT